MGRRPLSGGGLAGLGGPSSHSSPGSKGAGHGLPGPGHSPDVARADPRSQLAEPRPLRDARAVHATWGPYSALVLTTFRRFSRSWHRLAPARGLPHLSLGPREPRQPCGLPPTPPEPLPCPVGHLGAVLRACLPCTPRGDPQHTRAHVAPPSLQMLLRLHPRKWPSLSLPGLQAPLWPHSAPVPQCPRAVSSSKWPCEAEASRGQDLMGAWAGLWAPSWVMGVVTLWPSP